MRTTVTIDEDVERLLREVMHQTRGSFKETLNDALRVGLRAVVSEPGAGSFAVEPKPMGLLAGIDPAGLNKLVDELEEEELQQTPTGHPGP